MEHSTDPPVGPGVEHVTAQEGDAPPSLWDEYQQLVGLFRFYLELTVKTTSAYWAVSGGILALVLVNDRPEMVWALVIPILLSIGVSMALWKSRDMAQGLSREIAALAKTLKLKQPTHADILVQVVRWMSVLAAFAAVGLTVGAVAWL